MMFRKVSFVFGCTALLVSPVASFVSAADETTRRLCRELLDIFGEAAAGRWTRGELEEWCSALTRREKDVKLASGLAKILFDRAEFEESEHVEAFWFGRMRADLVNDASQEMHRKLIERLKFETQMGRYTDLNSAQDF